MKDKISKTEAKAIVEKFFSNIENKNSLEVKKIKKLAMRNNVALKEKRKLFCKYCLTPYIKPQIRIKNDKKIVKCVKCGKISRIKIS